MSKKAAVNDSLDGVGLLMMFCLVVLALMVGVFIVAGWLVYKAVQLIYRSVSSRTDEPIPASPERALVGVQTVAASHAGEAAVLSAPVSETFPQVHAAQGPTSVAVDDLQPPWNEEKIFQVIQSRYALDVQIDLMRLLAHAEESGCRIYYGSGAQPAIAGWYTSAGVEFSAWNLYLPSSAEDQSARVLVKLAGMKKKLGDAAVEEALSRTKFGDTKSSGTDSGNSVRVDDLTSADIDELIEATNFLIQR
ncbi:MAG TPA: hypothetical protein DCQ04_14425 [Actinobacteria bacterium]|nr:hypothetical protein [Actinomycetota bacterium]